MHDRKTKTQHRHLFEKFEVSSMERLGDSSKMTKTEPDEQHRFYAVALLDYFKCKGES